MQKRSESSFPSNLAVSLQRPLGAEPNMEPQGKQKGHWLAEAQLELPEAKYKGAGLELITTGKPYPLNQMHYDFFNFQISN